MGRPRGPVTMVAFLCFSHPLPEAPNLTHSSRFSGPCLPGWATPLSPRQLSICTCNGGEGSGSCLCSCLTPASCTGAPAVPSLLKPRRPGWEEREGVLGSWRPRLGRGKLRAGGRALGPEETGRRGGAWGGSEAEGVCLLMPPVDRAAPDLSVPRGLCPAAFAHRLWLLHLPQGCFGHGALCWTRGAVAMEQQFVYGEAPAPAVGETPEWAVSPPVLPKTQNFSLEGPKFPCPFWGTGHGSRN